MIDGQFQNPLTADDYDRIQRLKDIIRQTRPVCERAGRCNIDVTGALQTFAAMEEFARSVESEFFPNGRPMV